MRSRSAIGTYGRISRIGRPRMESGAGGPGTLVVTEATPRRGRYSAVPMTNATAANGSSQPIEVPSIRGRVEDVLLPDRETPDR